MPITFAAALLSALSMGGLPFFFGFLAKEEIYAALAAGNPRSIFFTVLAVIGNALMFALAFLVGLKPFLGRRSEAALQAHEGPPGLWTGPLVLALLGLAAALLPDLFHHYLSSPMASAVADHPVAVDIGTIPHLGPALYLSLLTIALGILLYLQGTRARALVIRVFDSLGDGPDRGFDHFVSGMVRLSVAVTRVLQPGRLELYVTATFAMVALTLLVPLFVFGELPDMPRWPGDMLLQEAAFLVIAVIGVLAVLRARNRLTAIVSLGIQGFAVAVIFLLFGAPDLSFTQFMVETLSVVILTLVMTKLRLSPSDHRPRRELLLDSTIAIACGTGFTLLLLKVLQLPFDRALTDFFNAYSKVIAHGANVVNVIIVDFRGTDTLGEIAVVMITGLAVLALIRVRAGVKPSVKPGAGDGRKLP
jgi:multicomponent Na+:H+ antiporter subunit A